MKSRMGSKAILNYFVPKGHIQIGKDSIVLQILGLLITTIT